VAKLKSWWAEQPESAVEPSSEVPSNDTPAEES
jgi:hypothetical protein